MNKIARMLPGVSLLGLVLAYGTWAQAGPNDTGLPTFSDSKAAQHVYTAVGVIKNNDMETAFICTNLDTVVVNIGVEVFNKLGFLVNNPATGTGIFQGNGEVLNVAVGGTVTIVTSGTALLADDEQISVGQNLRNGSGRVVATSKNISCTAMLLDEVHRIVAPDPNANDPLEPPPTAVNLPLIRVP